jgi:hypothetical protein
MLAVCREELAKRPPEERGRLAEVVAKAEREPLGEEELVREAARMFEDRARSRFR